jgi:hypothetical protein
MTEPRPLREREDALGGLLREASSLDVTEGERPAAARVRVRLFASDRRSSRWWWSALALGLAASAAVVLVSRPGSASAPLEAQGALDGATWSWAAEGAAREPGPEHDNTRDGRRLIIRSGRLDLERSSTIVLDTPGASIEVDHASLRVLVAASGTTVLFVHEGSVVVRPTRDGPPLHLGGGQQWASSTEDGDELLHRGALRLEAEGRPNLALQVLEPLSTRSSAWGELSLYDAARINADVGQRDAARWLIGEHRRRFPQGALGVEVAALAARLGANE